MPAFLGVLVEQIMRSMAASGALNQPPPTRKASPEALDALPVVPVKEELCDQDCPVCQDCFTEGEKVVRMPCGHSFHRPCLQPWMQSHNTCPTCRYELDTTDESYNQQLQEGRAKKIDVREERVMRETKQSTFSGWSIVELKEVLRGRGVDFSLALEKIDLVKLVKSTEPVVSRTQSGSPGSSSRGAMGLDRAQRRAGRREAVGPIGQRMGTRSRSTRASAASAAASAAAASAAASAVASASAAASAAGAAACAAAAHAGQATPRFVVGGGGSIPTAVLEQMARQLGRHAAGGAGGGAAGAPPRVTQSFPPIIMQVALPMSGSEGMPNMFRDLASAMAARHSQAVDAHRRAASGEGGAPPRG